MNYPRFFNTIPTLTLHDPLAKTLGAGSGMFTYSYLDAVKFAGHSCPTVAGAWLCVEKALDELCKDDIPFRGMFEVSIAESENSGVAGVIGSIFTLILGSAGMGGFKGLKGNFARNDLLIYGADITSQIKVTRLDTMQSVELVYDPSQIETNPKQMQLMQNIIAKTASDEEKKEFGILWQKHVKTIFKHKKELVKVI
jgi:hypothetical protein